MINYHYKLSPLFVIIVLLSCNIVEPIQEHTKTIDELLEDQAKEWIDTLCSDTFQGRRIGTEGNRLAFDYLCQEIIKMGYSLESQVFETNSGVPVRNIIVTIQGQNDSTVIIGGHFDGAIQSSEQYRYQAANDNCSGTVAMLMFLKSIKDSSIVFSRTVMCCFWDGEEGFEGSSLRGSGFFVSNIPSTSQQYLLFYENLDTIGHDHGNQIYIEFYGSDRVRDLAHALSLNGRFNYHIAESSAFHSDDYSFYKKGIPIINYHDHFNEECEHPNHRTTDIKEAISIRKLIKIVYNVRESIDSY